MFCPFPAVTERDGDAGAETGVTVLPLEKALELLVLEVVPAEKLPVTSVVEVLAELPEEVPEEPLLEEEPVVPEEEPDVVEAPLDEEESDVVEAPLLEEEDSGSIISMFTRASSSVFFELLPNMEEDSCFLETKILILANPALGKIPEQTSFPWHSLILADP